MCNAVLLSTYLALQNLMDYFSCRPIEPNANIAFCSIGRHEKKKNLILKLSNVLGKIMHFAITITRHEKERKSRFETIAFFWVERYYN